jgi:hypothetical protein
VVKKKDIDLKEKVRVTEKTDKMKDYLTKRVESGHTKGLKVTNELEEIMDMQFEQKGAYPWEEGYDHNKDS